MREIKAIVEFAENNFTAYIPCLDGVVGIGETLEKTKESLEQSIQYCIEDCMEDGIEVPEQIRGEFEIEYQYDLSTFLQVYGGILSKSGLEKLTGINQKQLWHYASGKKKPREVTKQKFADSLHKLANELAQVEFA